MIAQVWEEQFHNQTTTHTVGLTTLFVLGVALFFLPRRNAIVPILLMASILPMAQRIVVAGMDFNFIRILVLFGWLRVLLRRDYAGFRWSTPDFFLVLWTVSRISSYTFLHGTFPAFVFRLGSSFDSIGLYFLFRIFIRSFDDIYRIARTFAIISIPLAVFFLIERFTQRNLLSFLGDVPAITRERNGRLRCQGPYSHPILAGCYWASLLPLMASLYWRRERSKAVATIGLLCSGIIIVNCASSTPVLGTFAAALGMLLFAFRMSMREIRWLAVAVVLMLHMTMNKPVWHLISRVDLAGGSTGWHRVRLINETIEHFDEWWLAGTVSTAHWGDKMYDVTNQYILEAVRGGLITLILFLGILVVSYSQVGKGFRSAKRNRSLSILCWSLGVMLFVHCVNFLAVSYYGQITVLLYLTLALISSAPILRPVSRRLSSMATDRGSIPAAVH